MTTYRLIIHPKLHLVAVRLREKAYWSLVDAVRALQRHAERVERVHRSWGMK